MAKTYSWSHRLYRRNLAPLVATGTQACVRCGKLIEAGESWDLGHIDGSHRYAGPEHSRCNRATQTAGRVTATNQRRVVSRRW